MQSQKLFDEKRDIDDRLTTMRQFISGIGFTAIEHAEQVRLIRQLQYMIEYSNVLGERIAALP